MGGGGGSMLFIVAFYERGLTVDDDDESSLYLFGLTKKLKQNEQSSENIRLFRQRPLSPISKLSSSVFYQYQTKLLITFSI